MKKDWVLTQEDFDALLAWLHPDRDHAAQEYLIIRRKLVRIFLGRGCMVADELADETFNRVTVKLPTLANYEGEKILYFYGVGNNVYREWIKEQFKTKADQSFPFILPDHSDDEKRDNCLAQCLKGLPEDYRILILEYYQEVKRAKIEHRKMLAKQCGIALNALRIRVCRIRQQLKDCVAKCVEEMPAN